MPIFTTNIKASCITCYNTHGMNSFMADLLIILIDGAMKPIAISIIPLANAGNLSFFANCPRNVDGFISSLPIEEAIVIIIGPVVQDRAADLSNAS